MSQKGAGPPSKPGAGPPASAGSGSPARTLVERARGGDWDAIEDLVSGALAPTFDAALHLFEDPARAEAATEEALLSLLVSVHKGEFEGEDPLTATAKALVTAAEAAHASPFANGLTPVDLVVIARRPDDARRAELGKVPTLDRILAVLTFALDLSPDELGAALGKTPASIAGALARVLDAIPHEDAPQALRDILDARASRARLPLDVEERVLDRFEKS